MSDGRRDRTDRGAAALWVLACAAIVFAVCGVVTVRTLAVLARHRVEAAADLAALAGATRIGLGGNPCAAARAVAVANRANLTSCRLHLDAGGRSGTVTLIVRETVRLPFGAGGVAAAGARAARLPAVPRGRPLGP